MKRVAATLLPVVELDDLPAMASTATLKQRWVLGATMRSWMRRRASEALLPERREEASGDPGTRP